MFCVHANRSFTLLFIHSFSHSLLQSVSQSVSHSASLSFCPLCSRSGQSVVSFIHLPGLAQVALWPLEWLCPLERRPHELPWSTTGCDSGCDLNWPQAHLIWIWIRVWISFLFIRAQVAFVLFESHLPCEYIFSALEWWGRLQVASKVVPSFADELGCCVPYNRLEKLFFLFFLVYVLIYNSRFIRSNKFNKNSESENTTT